MFLYKEYMTRFPDATFDGSLADDVIARGVIDGEVEGVMWCLRMAEGRGYMMDRGMVSAIIELMADKGMVREAKAVRAVWGDPGDLAPLESVVYGASVRFNPMEGNGASKEIGLVNKDEEVVREGIYDLLKAIKELNEAGGGGETHGESRIQSGEKVRVGRRGTSFFPA